MRVMRRLLLRNASLYTHNFLHHSSSTTAPLAVSSHSRFRLFSSDDEPSTNETIFSFPTPSIKIKDIEEFKAMIDKCLKGDEQMEAIKKRRLSGKHEDTDDELIDEFIPEPIDDELVDKFIPEPIDDVDDQDSEEGFEVVHETDEEIVLKRMVKGTKAH
ncbi:hypothetical protein A2U01_0003242 [Trifolium medium]|uniref:Uncharacterized protein n=1 Tax=Trifolium medium TaxID=97028 RepID=A0A392M530_9FABA|nr:hypothetical protein [Trifolium medium]